MTRLYILIKKIYIKKIPRSIWNSFTHFRKKRQRAFKISELGKNILYIPKISGQAKTFQRAMLAHLQGISPCSGGTWCHFFLGGGQKMLACLFLYRCFYLHWLIKRLCVSRMQFFLKIIYLRLKLVIFYSNVSIGKIIEIAFY